MATYRFRSIGEMLAVCSIIVAIGGYGVYRMTFGAAREAQARKEQEDEARALRTELKALGAKGAAGRAACLKKLDAVITAAFPKGVNAAAPSPLPASRNVEFVNVRSPSGLTMPAPASVFAGPACAVKVPAPDEVDAIAGLDALRSALAAAKAAGVEPSPPPRFGVTDAACSKAAGCVGVVAWVTAAGQVEGVLQVKGPMRYSGYESDLRDLSRMADARLQEAGAAPP